MVPVLYWIVAALISAFVSIGFFFVLVCYDPDKKEYREKFRGALLSWKLYQIWNHFICLLIGGGGTAYYFINFRIKYISDWNKLSIEDYVLGLIFLLSVMGLLPYLLTNLTQGISAVINKAVGKITN